MSAGNPQNHRKKATFVLRKQGGLRLESNWMLVSNAEVFNAEEDLQRRYRVPADCEKSKTDS